MKKKILITGTSGFIGNFFLKNALNKGYEVTDILRLKNKKNKDLRQLKKKFPKSYNSIFFFKIKDLEKKLKNKKFDYFINFATLYKNSHSNSLISNFIESNISFPSTILDLVFQNTKKFINFGTMMQHCDGKNYISKNFYASTKSAFEMIINYFANQNKKLKYYNLKFFESFSENDKRKKLIPTLYRDFKKNKTTKIISKKLELNIIHIKDIVNATYNVMNNNIKSGDYCLVNPKNIKIEDLISTINNKSKKKLKIKFLSSMILRPQKSYLKVLPNFKFDTEIKNKIEKMFI